MRTGKLKGETKIIIPYFLTEQQRDYIMITIHGDVYASKVYAGIKQYVRDNFGIEVDKDWLESVPLISNQYDQQVEVSTEVANAMVEDWIGRIEEKDDAVEDSGHTCGESSDAQEAGGTMCSMQS